MDSMLEKYGGLESTIDYLERGDTLIWVDPADIIWMVKLLCGDVLPIEIKVDCGRKVSFYNWKKMNDLLEYMVGVDGAHYLRMVGTTDPAKYIKLRRKQIKGDLDLAEWERVMDKIDKISRK